MSKSKKKLLTYIERDVSWMYFNHRILQEARKKDVPLLERLSFLGIYSNNLDEFFRVRMASLNRIIESKNVTDEMEKKIKKTIKTIMKLNEDFNVEYSLATDEVNNELEQHNIRLINEEQLNDEQKSFLQQFYYDKLNGSTNPLWFSAINDFSVLEDNRIYLAVKKTSHESKKVKYAIIKIPDRVYGRFIRVPESDGYDNIMYLDDVIRYCTSIGVHWIGEKRLRGLLVQIHERC